VAASANRIWCDLETSGFDPRTGKSYIFELALVATTADAAYTELAFQSWVIARDLDLERWRDLLDPKVFEMHSRNGLLHELPFGVPQAIAEEQAVKFCQYFGNPIIGRDPIAGSSVHFDRSWLTSHMPTLMCQFSHRCFDASTLTQFARDLGCELPKGEPAHRALADVRASIQLARDVARAVRRG
jgi:oligoribonuclease